MSHGGPFSRSVPETAICFFALTFTHAGSLGLSWTTYGYLSRRFLVPLPPTDPEDEAENVKQLVLKDGCNRSRCKRGQQCIFVPIEAPWTYFYRIRHHWFPQAIQMFCTAAHVFIISGSPNLRRLEAGIDHMYVLALLGGGLAGLVVAKRGTLWLNSGGPVVLLRTLLKKHLPTVARALEADPIGEGCRLSKCHCRSEAQSTPTSLSNATVTTKSISNKHPPSECRKVHFRAKQEQNRHDATTSLLQDTSRSPSRRPMDLSTQNDEPLHLSRLESSSEAAQKSNSRSSTQKPAVPVIGTTSREPEESIVWDEWIEPGNLVAADEERLDRE